MSVCGVDLGNESSVVAIARRRGIDVCMNEVSKRTTSSLVGFTPRERVSGESALSQLTSNMRNTVGGMKLVLGRQFGDADVQAELARVHPVKAVPARDGTVAYEVEHEGKPTVFTAVQLSGLLLKKLRSIAEAEAGNVIKDAVLAVPIYYTDPQRRALLDAARIAELNVLGVLSEPCAMALSWGMPKSDLPEEGASTVNTAFVDFGETALTVSIAAFSKKKMTMLAVNYTTEVAGRLVDDMLVEHFARQIKEKQRFDVMERPRSVLRLRAACQRMKHVLSANLEAVTSVECIYDERDANLRMHRDELEQLCMPLAAKVVQLCHGVLASAGLSPDALSAVEMVGQASRAPWFQHALSNAFGGKPLSTTMNTSEAVARGATLFGAILSPAFTVREFDVHDYNWHPIQITCTLATAGQPDYVGEPESVFPVGNPIQSIKQLTFRRCDRLTIRAEYPSSHRLPGGVPSRIGEFAIENIAVPAADAKTKLKMKVRLNWLGVLAVDSAQLVEEYTVVEPPPPAAAPPAADAPAAEGSAPAPGADAAPAPAPAQPTQRIRRSPATVRQNVASLPHDELALLVEAERSMALRDSVIVETAFAKNALESFSYDMRDRLAGDLAPFVLPDVAAAIRAELQQTEEWLYDEGEDVDKATYEKRMAGHKRATDPIVHRCNEASARNSAVQALQRALAACRSELQSAAEAHAHISADERAKGTAEVENAAMWLGDKLAAQGSRAAHEDPAFTCAELEAKKKSVEALVKSIMSKPKPKPAPQPAAEPAAAAKQQEQQQQQQPQPQQEEAASNDGKPAENGDAMEVD